MLICPIMKTPIKSGNEIVFIPFIFEGIHVSKKSLISFPITGVYDEMNQDYISNIEKDFNVEMIESIFKCSIEEFVRYFAGKSGYEKLAKFKEQHKIKYNVGFMITLKATYEFILNQKNTTSEVNQKYLNDYKNDFIYMYEIIINRKRMDERCKEILKEENLTTDRRHALLSVINSSETLLKELKHHTQFFFLAIINSESLKVYENHLLKEENYTTDNLDKYLDMLLSTLIFDTFMKNHQLKYTINNNYVKEFNKEDLISFTEYQLELLKNL